MKKAAQTKKTDYFDQCLTNYSLKDLPGERWAIIRDYDNYAGSDHGRIKSLERWTQMPQGRERREQEKIMKPFLNTNFNKYLNRDFTHLYCRLSLNGHKHNISIGRLVYFHFVKKFDLNDRSVIISFKDDDSLHLHYSNLELLSISDQKYKMFRNNRAKSWKSDTKQPVVQYSMDAVLLQRYESIYAAEKQTGIASGSILVVLQQKSFTAGGFRWFPDDYKVMKKDFKAITANKAKTKDNSLNDGLWKKLGRPSIDRVNPPAPLNLSLKKLTGEKWKSIPGYEGLYEISSKGRVKKLTGWTSSSKKTLWGEQIMGLRCDRSKRLCITLTKDKKKTQVAMNRLLYYCFVKEFELSDHSLVVDDENEDVLNISISKLRLRTLSSVLREKRSKRKRQS